MGKGDEEVDDCVRDLFDVRDLHLELLLPFTGFAERRRDFVAGVLVRALGGRALLERLEERSEIEATDRDHVGRVGQVHKGAETECGGRVSAIRLVSTQE